MKQIVYETNLKIYSRATQFQYVKKTRSADESFFFKNLTVAFVADLLIGCRRTVPLAQLPSYRMLHPPP